MSEQGGLKARESPDVAEAWHLQAVQRFGQVGAPLELKAFSDGALVLQALQHSDAQVILAHQPCFPYHAPAQEMRFQRV